MRRDLAAHPVAPPAMGRDTLFQTLSSLALVGSECSALLSSKLRTSQFSVFKINHPKLGASEGVFQVPSRRQPEQAGRDLLDSWQRCSVQECFVVESNLWLHCHLQPLHHGDMGAPWISKS